MAVQQNKKSPARRNNRRSHDKLKIVQAISKDKHSGREHRRHHIDEFGSYRGKQYIISSAG